jgi:site-specific recombinase XerD
VQEILGHKTLAMVQRYSHLSASHLHEAVNRIAIGAGTRAATTA